MSDFIDEMIRLSKDMKKFKVRKKGKTRGRRSKKEIIAETLLDYLWDHGLKEKCLEAVRRTLFYGICASPKDIQFDPLNFEGDKK